MSDSDTVGVFLNSLHHPKLAQIDLSLERMHRLLAVLGSPQKRLPPVIHVAGTNGKGSLIAYLHAIFEAAGLRVHRYISPHLVYFRERIVVQGKEIDNVPLENILRHVASLLPNYPATFFEATTAAAFLAFAEKSADVLLMETGMGGRLDATNVIDKPLLTAITPVALDHMEFLGDTIEKIATEKAGIIKPRVPCVVGRQGAQGAAIIEAAARAAGAPLYRMGHEWQLFSSPHRGEAGRGAQRLPSEQASPPPNLPPNGGGIYHSAQRTLELAPSLAGDFQYDNAATAVACIDQMPQFSITDAQIAHGLSHTFWPARLQKLDKGRFSKILPPGIELWLDGGHNAQGGEVLGRWLSQQTAEIYLVCGMIRGKDSAEFLKFLAPHARALYAITIPGEAQSKPAEQVEMAARGIGMETASCPSLENALQTIARRAKTPAIICICGSLYLAGKVLAADNL